ncbi:MAG: hypothetical protein AAFZ67_11395 [Planctomycetota bacterium]
MSVDQLSTREVILSLLDHPRPVRQLAELSGRHIDAVHSAVRRMRRDRLVKPLTRARQSVLYGLTPLGRILRDQVLSDGASPERRHTDLELFAWVSAGAHRRTVLACLTDPLTARRLRKRVITVHERTGSTHVYHTLRELEDRGLVARSEGLWQTTPLGRDLQRVLGIRAPGPADWSSPAIRTASGPHGVDATRR